MRMRNIRRGRGDKGGRGKRSAKQTRRRETRRGAVPIREGSRNDAFDATARVDARGKDPPTQESRPLFGFKEGKGCKTRGGRGDQRAREGLEGADGLAEMANAYGSSPEVRECKFYDQSGGLIRCAAALNGEKKRERERERERERSVRGNIRIGEKHR